MDSPVLLLMCTLLTHAIVSDAGPPFVKEVCGRRPAEANGLIGRVVGGHPAMVGEVPWQASIHEERLFGLITYRKCGAVVIHPTWLLTAAHCTVGWYFSRLTLMAGEHEDPVEKKPKQKVKNQSQPLASPKLKSRVQQRKVKRVITHPDFSPADLEDDIALIELDRPLVFDASVQPICLPFKGTNFTRRQGTVSGWGFTKYRECPSLSLVHR